MSPPDSITGLYSRGKETTMSMRTNELFFLRHTLTLASTLASPEFVEESGHRVEEGYVTDIITDKSLK